MNGRCWWRGHKWTRWELKVVTVIFSNGYRVDADRNERTCLRCGLVRRRDV